MGKKNKIPEKVKLFYRGPSRKPTRIADVNDMPIIVNALKDCFAKKDRAFNTLWDGKNVNFQLIAGLSSSLRCLKQNRTQAIVYDDTAAPHLTRYLNEFAYKSNIPIIQAHRLIDIAPQFNLKTLLVASIVRLVSGEEKIYMTSGLPKPKAIKEIIVSEAFNELCKLLQSATRTEKTIGTGNVSFQLPLLDKVTATGSSKAKKEKKKLKKPKAK